MNAISEYPREKIPKNPVLSLATVAGRRTNAIPSVMDAGYPKFVIRGSMATGLSLAHAGVGPEHSVLLPAYHCTSMVLPVVWRSARPIFYRIHEDTSIDLADVESKLDPSTRAIVVPHYFGFAQDGLRIRAFCDRHGLIFIEDCAHAFFGSYAGRPLGSFGDYAIASPWKFFPTYDGGLLVSASRDLKGIELLSPGSYFDAKSALNCLEYAFEYQRLSVLKVLLFVPLLIKKGVWHAKTTNGARSGANGDAGGAGSGFPLFDPAWVDMRSSLPARWIIEAAAKDRIIENRRRNYSYLSAQLADVEGCHALFPELPDCAVPQVFPLVVDEAERVFDRLKRKGVPIIRFGETLWPGVDSTICPVAADYSRRVFQFPCHQDLAEDDLRWMAAAIKAAVSHVPD